MLDQSRGLARDIADRDRRDLSTNFDPVAGAAKQREKVDERLRKETPLAITDRSFPACRVTPIQSK